MSFEINGETWEPQTATEHAGAIIEEINYLLRENNVMDDKGNVIQLKQNYGNALYLLALGDGQRFADNDAKLSRAINSFNVELCDNKQIENLLPIAAVTRNPGSYSTLRLTVKASEDGDCTIPAGTKAPYGNVNFVVQEEVVISAGSTQIIKTFCDTLGPIAVLTGEITSFESTIVNLESVENQESSVPGVSPETTNELRKRLINGDTIRYSLDGCKKALEELTGVSYARVYFNYNTEEEMELPGGVIIQPRHAYVVIHGASDHIAQVYAEYMSAPTQNNPDAEGTKSTVNINVTAGPGGDATLPAGTSAHYEGHEFVINQETTVTSGSTTAVPFTCSEVGPYNVPPYGIEGLDQTIENVVSAQNYIAAIPGTDDPKHVQNWITQSGQTVPIYYDDAIDRNVFIKVWLKADAPIGPQIDNQIKRDLIQSSASWKIGESITQLLTGAPFINCTYTDVAYTEVSLDGVTWEPVIEVGCNVIPRITDATITVDQVEE